MENREDLKSAILDWAATRSDEAVLSPQKNYYPTDVIIEAYTEGYKQGEKNLKEITRKRYFSTAKLVAKAVGDIHAKFIDKCFEPEKIFISISVDTGNILYVFDEDVFISDKFIDNMYGTASDIKTKYFDEGLDLEIQFVNSSSITDIDQFRCDGYGIAFEVGSGELLY